MKKIQEILKQNKGITTADIAIAVIILMIFVSLIATAFYQYYITTTGQNRNAIATNACIDIIEQTKKMNYEIVTQESVENLVAKMKEGISLLQGGTIILPKGYDIRVTLQPYQALEQNVNTQDRIKQLTVKVTYTVGKKEHQVEMSKLMIK